MLQKEMTTEFEKLIKQPVHTRCRTKAVPAAATSTVKAEHITAADAEDSETMTSTEPTTQHDKCPYSPSDVIIQLKVEKKQTKYSFFIYFILALLYGFHSYLEMFLQIKIQMAQDPVS